MKYSIYEILKATGGYIFYQSPLFDKNAEFELNCTSNVEIKDGAIFIPLYILINGARTNSFESLEGVICSGIRMILFDETRFAEPEAYNKLMNIINQHPDKLDCIIMVQDTLKAIFDLASFTRTYKMSKHTKYIAVTGSIGKTSTTEMLYGILNLKNKVYRGEPGANIKLRVAHKFLETDPDVDYLLFECSGQGRGYLKFFSELIMPDGIILTKVANENLGEYRTLLNVANEKSTLMSAMSKDSVAVINGMDILRKAAERYVCEKVFVNEGDYTLISTDKNGSRFIYKNEEFFIPVVGIHQIDNAAKVIELSKRLGFSYEDIKQGLENYEAIGDRWVVDEFGENIHFITDCPNNPSYDTLITNINVFMELYKDSKYKRIIITRIKALGDLEEKTYKDIAVFISKLNINELVCVGSEINLIRDYVSQNSNIKVVSFEKPTEINEQDDFVKYLLSTMNFEQATLLKGQRKDGSIGYGAVKYVLRENLK